MWCNDNFSSMSDRGMYMLVVGRSIGFIRKEIAARLVTIDLIVFVSSVRTRIRRRTNLVQSPIVCDPNFNMR